MQKTHSAVKVANNQKSKNSKANRLSQNNIDNWMKKNLLHVDYEVLLRDMPMLVGISPKTWYSIRFNKTNSKLDILMKIHNELKPYGCQSLDELLFIEPKICLTKKHKAL